MFTSWLLLAFSQHRVLCAHYTVRGYLWCANRVAPISVLCESQVLELKHLAPRAWGRALPCGRPVGILGALSRLFSRAEALLCT